MQFRLNTKCLLNLHGFCFGSKQQCDTEVVVYIEIFEKQC